MEIVGLAILAIGLLMYYGVFKSVDIAARMANRKMARLEAEQIKADINYYASKDMPAETEYTKAVANKAMFDKFRDL